LSTSYGQIRVRTQSLIIRDLQDSYYTSLLKSGGSVSNFDLGGGLVFYSNKLLIGYSVNSLAGTRFESNLASNDRPPMSQYLMVGYKFDINGSWKFDPSILVRHQVGTPIFYNVQAKFSYNETVWAGLAYISDKTISLLAGYEVSKKFQIGYSYDIGMGSQNNVLSNTNELILGFKPFIKEKKSETPEE
jgi:type IX secretion system PorP/SprF family membrane protein